MASFLATLFKVPGKGGWTFVPVPPELAPPVTGRWGMTPVRARVDGRAWSTTVWRDATHGALLPVPAKVRGGKGDGDTVEVELELDETRVVA